MTTVRWAGGDARRWAAFLVALLLPLAGLAAIAPAADAATTMTSYRDFVYDSGATEAPSADKPQSKLWFHAGRWWALMLTPASAGAGDVNIFQLQSDHTWRDTGVTVDSRANATGDALPDGDRLYVVSREGRSDIRVARFAFDDTGGTYRANGTPATITTKKAESATIAKDTLGRLWVTFTNGKRVWVMHTATGNETSWTAPFTPQVSDVAIDSDDISAVVALPGAVGVMWSDQASSAFRFAVHRDGDPDTTWRMETVMSSPAIADDHINIKSLAAGDDGRVYAAVKSSLNDVSGAKASDPQVFVFTRSNTGSWTSTVAGTVDDDMTRPVLVLDETNRQMYLFYTVDYLTAGKVYYKTSPLGATLDFASGRGTRAISYSGTDINNPSGSKDPVNSTTGLVVLASDDVSRTYYHAEMDLAPVVADTTPPSKPTVSVAVAPGKATVSWTEATDNVAVAGYRVVRDGTAIWEGTSGTSYADSPVGAGSHTYAVAAFDGAGNVTTSDPRTVTVPAPTTSDIAVRAVSKAASPGTTSLSVPMPAGVQGGDLLLAAIDVRSAPTITAPAGWTLIRSQASGSKLRVQTYWKVAGASEPASAAWTLSSSQPVAASVVAYTGAATSVPIEVFASRYKGSSTTIPTASITTKSPRAMVVAVYATATGTSVTPPSGLTERADVASSTSKSGITLAVADYRQDAPGATGDRAATAAASARNASIILAIKPAG